MKAIKYTRYSSDGQSSFSIERQDLIIENWTRFNKVEITDAFKDEGHSARTFDRPDVKKLFAFIKKNYRQIDYLVVAELTRFSREAGSAITMVKQIQQDYGIRIVSASRAAIYDVFDSSSYFMMGLEFLLGTSENIKRQNDINGGIYAAKVEKGRWIQGGPAPYGYRKEGIGENRLLVQVPEQAAVIRYIFTAFLAGTPVYLIRQQAKALGFPKTGNDALHEILKNPLYMGQQYVKAWKNNPGGLYPLKNFQPVIDQHTWDAAQKLFKTEKPRVTITEQFPLRGVVKCHCSRPLTAAPSRSRNGQYYGYYKCNTGGHLNRSAKTMHSQLQQILATLRIPECILDAVEKRSAVLLEEKMKGNNLLSASLRSKLQQTTKKLESLEEKFILNQVNFEMYNRWHGEYSREISSHRSELQRLDRDADQVLLLTRQNLSRMNQLAQFYESADTLGKQQLIKKVFDNRLYYQKDRYRTAYLMPVFHHNLPELSNLQLLEFDGIRPNSGEVDPAGLLSNLSDFIQLLRTA